MTFDLDKHLAQEHNRTPFVNYLKEIVYGGNDGIVTTFAIVAGFTGASTEVTTLPLAAVLLFGFANLFADGVSMSMGNFLSSNSEKDIYASFKQKELKEIKQHPQQEVAESIEILIRKGFSREQAEQLTSIYKTNERYWLDFMMEKELELPNPERESSWKMAIATFLSFTGFGLIPLLPYVFLRNEPHLFLYSIATTVGALTLLGLLRWRVTRQHWARSLIETLLLGGAAASVAYIVGTLFRVKV